MVRSLSGQRVIEAGFSTRDPSGNEIDLVLGSQADSGQEAFVRYLRGEAVVLHAVEPFM